LPADIVDSAAASLDRRTADAIVINSRGARDRT